MNLLKNLSDKTTDYLEIVKTNPTTLLKPVLLFTALITVLILFGYLVELLSQLRHDRRYENQGILLEILPKETVKPKDTEVLIRNIHAVLLNTKWRKMLYGRPYMSYEIVAEKDKIKFYIKVPKDYKNVIIERIYATYSEIAINEVAEDYLLERVWPSNKDVLLFLYRVITYPFKKIPFKSLKTHLGIAGTEMELGYHHVLKIKTKTDKDILGSIMAGMKNLEWHEKVVVQILARPLDNDWQLKGRRVLEQFERNGIRPMRGSDFRNFFNSLLNQLGDDLDDELSRAGMKPIGSSSAKKTRIDRKEITVASDKLLEPGFETVIRVMAVGHYRKGSTNRVKGITAAWNELDQENRFKRDVIFAKKLLYNRTKNRRMYLVDRQNILTPSELSNFFMRLPSAELIDDFPEIEFLKVKEFAPPRNVETSQNIIGKNFYRGEETLIGIKLRDLVRHMVVQGRTGTGKSEWLKTFLLEHIQKGYGCMLLEPHGKLADEFLAIIPENRRKDVIYFDLFDSHPPAFNFCKVFDRKGISYEDQLEKTTEEVIEIFAREFSDAWSSKNEYYITNALKTVIELQQGGILDIQRLFVDKKFREYAVSNIKDGQVKSFWTSEFAETNGKLSTSTQATVLSVMHKLGKFLNSKKLLRSVGQEGCIDFKEVLDNNKIVIFRFSKDNMSEDRIRFLGGIALKLLIVASFAREKSKWNDPFILAIDEAQNFVSNSIETVLDELRKFGIALLPMHQRLAQMDKVPGLINAIYGNVGTTITFAVGEPDAPYFEKIYGPRADADDLKNLPSRYGYCKLLVDGETSNTFNIYSVDSPLVDKKTAKESVFEIKKHNREGRLHYKQIDKMLHDRIDNYNKLDENGADTGENSQSFVEELDERYNVVEEIESYKQAAAPAPPNNNAAYIDVAADPDEDLSIYVENLYKAHEENSEEEFKKMLDSWIDPTEAKEDESDEIIEVIELEEDLDDIDEDIIVKDPMVVQIEDEKKITLADFLESEDDKIEEVIEKDEMTINLDEYNDYLKGLEQIEDDEPEFNEIKEILVEEVAVTEEIQPGNTIEDYIDPETLWGKSKEIEEKAIERANQKPQDSKQEIAKNLWDMAKQKEKESKSK